MTSYILRDEIQTLDSRDTKILYNESSMVDEMKAYHTSKNVVKLETERHDDEDEGQGKKVAKKVKVKGHILIFLNYRPWSVET